MGLYFRTLITGTLYTISTIAPTIFFLTIPTIYEINSVNFFGTRNKSYLNTQNCF